MTKPLSLIVALANNWGIGKNNDLLFYISEDLKRFKKLTTGHKIIMGRKTFESLPNGPLPKREHIILSRNKEYKAENCQLVSSVEEVLELCDACSENFIIGGGTIYSLLLPHTTKMYLTLVDSDPDADTFFSKIIEDEWKVTEETEFRKDEKSGLKYKYKTLERIIT